MIFRHLDFVDFDVILEHFLDLFFLDLILGCDFGVILETFFGGLMAEMTVYAVRHAILVEFEGVEMVWFWGGFGSDFGRILGGINAYDVPSDTPSN